MIRLAVITLVVLIASCARLDHVQIGEIDQTQGNLVKFTIQVSELGVDAAGIAEIARMSTKGNTSREMRQIRDLLALINMGPRTGNPVYNDTYAQRVLNYIYAECPSGKVTGLTSIREAIGAGPVSGEIVRIDGYCIQQFLASSPLKPII
jgi:hypothetical protein